MSRQIDTTKPLSEEDKEYLRSRSRQWEIDRLENEQAEKSGVLVDGDDAPPADPAAEGSGEGGEGEGDFTDYTEWTNEQLRAELKERGLSSDGNKADLIDRLEEDDDRED